MRAPRRCSYGNAGVKLNGKSSGPPQDVSRHASGIARAPETLAHRHDSNLGARLRMVADGEVSGHAKLLTESHTEHDHGVLTTHWRANGRRGGGTGR
jgi:hypothetical protein